MSPEIMKRRNEILPRGDRSGPEGYGPRTGRALGFCSGSNSPGFARDIFGRGMGYGGGGGRGRGFGKIVSPGRGYGRRIGFGRGGLYVLDRAYQVEDPRRSNDEERAYLESLVSDMEKELDGARNRLKELSKKE